MRNLLEPNKRTKMNGYDLTRNWYNYKFENSNVKAIHTDFYLYLVDQWNRLGQKKEFGLPTSVTMECLGIGSYNTYKKVLYDLIDFGFVAIVKESKNQHNAKSVALLKIDKALDKALDKATIKASDEPFDKASDTIDKQLNNYNNLTIEQINNLLGYANKLSISDLNIFLKSLKSKPVDENFNFKKSLLEYGFKENLVEDWLKVRKTKKSSNTETAFNKFIVEIEKRKCDLNQVLEIIVSNSWSGFSWNWIDNINNTNKNGTTTKSNTEIAVAAFNSETAKNFRFK